MLSPEVHDPVAVAIILTHPEKSAFHVNSPVKLSVEVITPAEGLSSDQTTGKSDVIREVSPPVVGQTGKGVITSTKIAGGVSSASNILTVRLAGVPGFPSQLIGVATTLKVPQKPVFQSISPVKTSIIPGLATPVKPPPGKIASKDHSIEA